MKTGRRRRAPVTIFSDATHEKIYSEKVVQNQNYCRHLRAYVGNRTDFLYRTVAAFHIRRGPSGWQSTEPTPSEATGISLDMSH
jgi:hypothetical protein